MYVFCHSETICPTQKYSFKVLGSIINVLVTYFFFFLFFFSNISFFVSQPFWANHIVRYYELLLVKLQEPPVARAMSRYTYARCHNLHEKDANELQWCEHLVCSGLCFVDAMATTRLLCVFMCVCVCVCVCVCPRLCVPPSLSLFFLLTFNVYWHQLSNYVLVTKKCVKISLWLIPKLSIVFQKFFFFLILDVS